MAEIVDPGASQSPQTAPHVGRGMSPGSAATQFQPRLPVGEGGSRPKKDQKGQPSKPSILADLEWAYRNIETNAKPKNAQQELFRGDFIQDREKTLRLMVGLQKEYRDRMEEWRKERKAAAGKLALAGAAGSSSSSGASGAGGAGAMLGPDEGEERVRDMMKRLLEEAAHVSQRV